MKILKNSWHYRFLNWMNVYPECKINLCEYMRSLFFWGLFVLWLVASPFLFVPAVYLLLKYPDLNNLTGLLIFISFWISLIGTALSAIVSLVWINEKYPKLFNWLKWPAPEYKQEKPKEPNLFIEWLKAKKKKICPMLEFVD